MTGVAHELRTVLASCTAAQLANAGLTPPPGVDVASGMDPITLAFLQSTRIATSGTMRDHVQANPATEDFLFGNGADDFDSFDEWYNAHMGDDSNAASVDLWQSGVCTLLMGLAMRLNITSLTLSIKRSMLWMTA